MTQSAKANHDDDRVDAYLVRCREIIKKYGWMVQGVFPTVNEPDDVPFAYTVGLTDAGLPELTVSGLGPEQAMAILNTAAQQHCRQEFTAGSLAEEIAANGVVFRVIDAPDVVMGIGQRLYGGRPLRALQIVWPDREGHFPGDPGWLHPGAQEIFGGRWAA